MRTIKFRGKGPRAGNWFYGNLFMDMYGRTHIFSLEVGGLEVKPETIGQFTGLCDCDGKEIYEGDVLRLWNSPSGVCEVKWNESLATFCIRFFGDVEIGSLPLGEWVICERKVEVIGNIYDNPELMKGGEK